MRMATSPQSVVCSGGNFLLALGVRVLMLHNSQVEARKVQSGVAADYQRTAELLQDVGPRGFFDAVRFSVS